VNNAIHIGTGSVYSRVNRRLRGNRPFAGDPFAVKVHRANIFDVRKHSGKARIDEKGFGTGDPSAQVTGARQHTLSGDDLHTFDETTL